MLFDCGRLILFVKNVKVKEEKKMYLHIGNSKNLRTREIIGIFDLDSSSVSATTRKYLSAAEKCGRLESATEELPKSFILYGDGKNTKVCLSQLSSASLLSRTEIK